MKKYLLLSLLLLIACVSMAQSENLLEITIDGRSMKATLADNVATRALVERLTAGPITVTMNNYGGFEKVGALPWSLPTSDTRLTTRPGDIMLYTGNNIVIFYGANTWAYTPLGVLETTDPTAINSFVGNGAKQVTISLDRSAGVECVTADEVKTDERVFTLNGREVLRRPLAPGLYIVNKKKVMIK